MATALTAWSYGAGISFGSQVGSSSIDLSKHVNLYGGQYGISVTGGRINLAVPSGSSLFGVVNGADVLQVSGTGINATAIGATTPSTGAFSTLSANSTLSATGVANFQGAGKTTSSTFNNTGLSVAWNISAGGGEVDLLLGPQGGAGGLAVYQLNTSGGFLSTTPTLVLDRFGNLSTSGGINSTPIGASTAAAGRFTGVAIDGAAASANRYETISAGSVARWSYGAPSGAENFLTLTTSAAQGSAGTGLTFASTTGVSAGMLVKGTSIAAGTTVASFTATSVTLSASTTAAVASGAAVLFYTNAGSNFSLSSYADDGSALTAGVISATRATGAVSIPGSLSTGALAASSGSGFANGLVLSGYLIQTYNQNGTLPAAGNGGGVSWNFSAGSSEIDFWNHVNGPLSSFRFYQRTSGGSSLLAEITPAGTLSCARFAQSVAASVAAAGTTLATGTVLSAATNYVNSGTGGVVMPNITTIGVECEIYNATTSTITVYPISASYSINKNTAGAGVALTAGNSIFLRVASSTLIVAATGSMP